MSVDNIADVWNDSSDDLDDEYASALEEIEALAANYAKSESSSLHTPAPVAADHQKQLDKQFRVVNEIVETEETYVKSLTAVVQLYIVPLRAATDQAGLLSEDAMTKLFSSIETLTALNGRFLTELQESISGHNARTSYCQLIGRAFSRFAPFFKMYSQYICNYDQANELLVRLKDNSRFQTFCKQAEADPRSKSLNLASLLITPIQRVPRYRLLLQELIKCSPGDPALPPLKASLELVSRVADKINEDAKLHEERNKLRLIEDTFFSHPGFTAPGRHLLRQGELTRHAKNNNQLCEFFLFNNMLAYATTLPFASLGGKRFMLERKLAIDKFFSVEMLNPNPPCPTDAKASTNSSDDKKDNKAGAENQNQKQKQQSESQAGNDMTTQQQQPQQPQQQQQQQQQPETRAAEAADALKADSFPDGAFAVRSPQVSFIAYARTPEESRAWFTDLIGCCQRQRELCGGRVLLSRMSSKRRVLEAQSAQEERVSVFRQPLWEEDMASDTCRCCKVAFSTFTRRHHCRVCGRLVCDACSKNRTVVAGGQPQRTCNLCVSRINNALSPHPPSMPPTHPAVLPSSSSSFPSSLSSSSSSSSSAAANMLNSLNPDPRKPLTTNTGIAASKSTTVAVAVSSARSLVPPPSPSVPQQEQLSASLSEHVLSALQRQSDQIDSIDKAMRKQDERLSKLESFVKMLGNEVLRRKETEK